MQRQRCGDNLDGSPAIILGKNVQGTLLTAFPVRGGLILGGPGKKPSGAACCCPTASLARVPQCRRRHAAAAAAGAEGRLSLFVSAMAGAILTAYLCTRMDRERGHARLLQVATLGRSSRRNNRVSQMNNIGERSRPNLQSDDAQARAGAVGALQKSWRRLGWPFRCGISRVHHTNIGGSCGGCRGRSVYRRNRGHGRWRC